MSSQSGELAASSFYKRWRRDSLENEAASTSVRHWPIGRPLNSHALQHFSHGLQHSRILQAPMRRTMHCSLCSPRRIAMIEARLERKQPRTAKKNAAMTDFLVM